MDIAKSLCSILAQLERIPELTITVMGDYCLDTYFYISSARDEDSVETGLTAYQVERKAVYPGVGGTVTANLRALGAKVRCVGLLGDDGEGVMLKRKLEELGADTRGMVISPQVHTNTYIKPMRDDENGTYHELNRLDIRNFSPTPTPLEEQLIQNLEISAAQSHGVIVTDQFFELNCSAITTRVREALGQLADKYPDTFFYVDSRAHINQYENVLIKCNHLELMQAVAPEHQGDITADHIEAGGQQLYQRVHRPVIVTQGKEGALVFSGDQPVSVPAFPVDGPIDIVGAGDATNAGTVLGLCLGLSLPTAALLGGAVSSITIQQIGVTGTATVPQVRSRLEERLAAEDSQKEGAHP